MITRNGEKRADMKKGARYNLKRQHRCKNRSGTIAIAVLVCIFVVTTIAISSMAISIRHRRQLRDDIRIEQTRWILDGSVRMAISKLRQQPDYNGETVNVVTDLSVFKNATVVVTTSPADQAGKVKLEVSTELSRAKIPDPTHLPGMFKKKYRRSASLLVSINEQ